MKCCSLAVVSLTLSLAQGGCEMLVFFDTSQSLAERVTQMSKVENLQWWPHSSGSNLGHRCLNNSNVKLPCQMQQHRSHHRGKCVWNASNGCLSSQGASVRKHCWQLGQQAVWGAPQMSGCPNCSVESLPQCPRF